MINIAEPEISEEDIQHVVKALKANSVSTYGKEVNNFETILVQHSSFDAVAVNSGTSALEVSIDCYFNNLYRNTKRTIGFCDYTFIATPNAILNTANIPLPIPCDPTDFTIDTAYFESLIHKKQKIDLLIITLPFGNYNNKIEELVAICEKNSIPVIIDAAASIAIDFRSFANVISKCVSVCLSFNGNKVITSGAGGAILSGDNDLVKNARNLISLNRMSNYEHYAPGQNKKMPALNAALGISQILQLEKKVKDRIRIYELYKLFEDQFLDMGFELFPDGQYLLNAHWIYFLKPISEKRDMNSFRTKLREKGFNSPAFWKPVSEQTEYKKFLPIEGEISKVNYPDLFQLPMTLKNPVLEVRRLVEAMKGVL